MVKSRYQRKPFKPISKDRFKQTRLNAGLSKAQVASMLFVSLRTVQHWESGFARIPYAAFKLLRIHTLQELPGSAWRGWSISGDTLVSPEGKNFSTGDLNALALTFAIVRQWKKEYAQRQSSERARSACESEAAKPSPLSLVKS